MHVLDRPYLPRAIVVAVLAALGAIVLTLAVASRLNDVRSAPTPAPAPMARSAPVASPAPMVQAPVARPVAGTNPFTRSPLSPLLNLPAATPWTDHR